MIETLPFIAVLASALLHAVWNAVVRSGSEPGDMLACGVIASGIVGLFGLAWFGLPARESWPWLIGGVIVNTIGIRLAMAAYRSASFGLAYPVMRAGIPLLSLPVGVVMLGEWPRQAGVVGVLLIAAALIMLAMAARASGRAELKGLAYALAASVAGVGYVVSDAVGIRVSGNIYGYAFAVAVGNGVAIILLMLVLERRNVLRELPRHAAGAFTIAALSTASFQLYVYAIAVTPVALAAALRETSVFFAVAIARFVLREPVGGYHWLAALLAVAGIFTIRLG